MMSLNYLLKVEISPGRISLDTNPSRSGLYIRVYEIDEDFSLWIGGGSPIGTPMYIRLKCNDVDVYADVTKDDIAAFIEKHTKEGPILYDRPLSYYIDLAWAEAEPIALAKRYGVQKTDRMVMHDNDKTVTVVFSDSARNDSWSEIHVTLTPQSDGSYAVDSSLTTATSEAALQTEIDSSIEAARTQTAIANLFAEIESSPAYSPNPKDYIDAHPDAYQKFVEYGNHSLIFIFNEFLGGGQPGLHGHILCSVMTELLNENEIIKCNAVNGQDYFDHWLASARSVGEQHDAA